MQEELSNVEDTIQLTDVSSLSGSDSNSSSDSRASAVVCCVNPHSNSNDIKVKAEILSEDQLNPPTQLSRLAPTIIHGQCASGFQKQEDDARKGHNSAVCCCVHAQNCQEFSSVKPSTLVEKFLAKQLQNESTHIETSMSAYEKAHLQLERQKYELQEKTVKCLRNISKEIRQIRASFCRVKRRRKHENYAISHKRQRWHSESDSSPTPIK